MLLDVVPWAGRLYDVAVEAWEDYCRDQREDALRAEVQAIAQAPTAQVRREVEQAVGAEAAGQPPEVRQALTAYLSQVPAAIRRTLRRPSDPTGTTVPAGLALRGPEDLVPLLPPRPPRFKPGDRLPGAEDWELVEPLGAGGFGEVWLARHATFRATRAAVKFCLEEAARQRLLEHEGALVDRVMQQGRHPGIVPLLDAKLDADPPWLKYEYVEGGDLAGVIQELHAGGPLPVEAANRLFLRLAEIVAAAHGGKPPVVHDDLKPSNVLVRRGAEGELGLFVTDFGIGGLAADRAARESRRRTRSQQELHTEAVRGAYTPLYASPQQVARRRGEPADLRDDVHALGVIWFQLMTGDLGMLSVPPDWREQVQERGLGEKLTDLLASCVSSRAEKRPASAVVLAQDLRAALPSAQGDQKAAGPAHQGLARRLGRQLMPAARRLVGFLVRPGSRRPADSGVHPPQPQLTPRVLPDVGGLDIGVDDAQRHQAPGELSGQVEAARRLVEQARAQVRQGRLPKEPRPGEVIGNSLGMRFASCPPGTFRMGSPRTEDERDDDETQHRVALSNGFWLGVTPVTQAQWQAIMGSDPSLFKGKDRPVEMVSWEDCQAFCAKLGAHDGLRYRLPTEAEWEFACRARTTTPFFFGETISTEQANYDGTVAYGRGKKGMDRRQTTPVGSFPANAWGLRDMHGNVWEWCQDWYGAYPSEDIKDPQGSNSGGTRVLRGGSWSGYPTGCRSACRSRLAPGDRNGSVGCRVVLCPD
jgi:formylglycine-generating enzyme required for sulfatase activity/serine/threonine protein kinase